MRKVLFIVMGVLAFFAQETFAQGTIIKYTANGTYTVPPGVTQIQVEAWGGGGGGSSRTSTGRGGGGGGGAYARSVIAVTPGQMFYVNVGAGGSGSTAGQSSWINTVNSSPSGQYVLAAGGSGGANNSTGGGNGGTTGASYGTVITRAGGSGATGTGSGTGGGGSSATPLAAGNAGTVPVGGTAPSVGGNGANGHNTAGANGSAGFIPGGGGSGARNNATGGNGASGEVVIVEQTATTHVYNVPDASRYQWVVPPGVTQIYVQTWGGGGNGGQRTSNNQGAGGGGGGAYSSGIISVTPGNTVYINVGEGSTSNASPGGDSWVNTSNTAPTNNNAVLAKGGNSGVSGNGTYNGATGGQASASFGNGTNHKNNGGNGANSAASTSGGGGGSSASYNNTVGIAGSGVSGGTAPVGGGNGGDGKQSNNQGPGLAGVAPGGGGGGSYRTSATQPGGAGAHGQVILTVVTADVGVFQTVNSLTPSVGGPVTITLSVTNYGPQTANTVNMTNIIGAGFTVADPSDVTVSQGSINFMTGTWNIGNLSPGITATATITATVNPTGSYTNTAAVTADQLDLNMTNNSSSLTLYPVTPMTNLRIIKEADDYQPLVGETVTFTLTAHNHGPHTSSGVTVEDVLPTGLVYQSHSTITGAYNDVTGIWSVGSLANGVSATLTITAVVQATGSYVNVAEIQGNEVDPDASSNTSSITIYPRYAEDVTIDLDCALNTYNFNNFGDDYSIDNQPPGTNVSWHTGSVATSFNLVPPADLAAASPGTYYLAFYDPVEGCYSATIPVHIAYNCADLAIQKAVNNQTPTAGQVVIFALIISNDGPADATNILVVDELPNGYGEITGISSVGGVSPVAGDWDEDEGTITWSIPSLPEGTSITFTYEAVVLPKGVGVSHTNKATVTATDQVDINLANNESEITINPRQAMIITNPMLRSRARGGG